MQKLRKGDGPAPWELSLLKATPEYLFLFLPPSTFIFYLIHQTSLFPYLFTSHFNSNMNMNLFPLFQQQYEYECFPLALSPPLFFFFFFNRIHNILLQILKCIVICGFINSMTPVKVLPSKGDFFGVQQNLRSHTQNKLVSSLFSCYPLCHNI